MRTLIIVVVILGIVGFIMYKSKPKTDERVSKKDDTQNPDADTTTETVIPHRIENGVKSPGVVKKLNLMNEEKRNVNDTRVISMSQPPPVKDANDTRVKYSKEAKTARTIGQRSRPIGMTGKSTRPINQRGLATMRG